MPLIEKEIIAPGTYFYNDLKTGDPRKLVVTPELTKYWKDQGSAMLSAGLTVPVPYEHDFNAHPMTPKDKLLNNAGWVNSYLVKDAPDPITGQTRKDVLFGLVDIQDEKIVDKLPTTIKWTSPWFNSFMDGKGNKWNNVISHLALTLKPRITNQQPFPAAALSIEATSLDQPIDGGFFLSRASKVVRRKSDKVLVPCHPMAFSLFTGVALGDDKPPKKAPPKPKNPPESQGGKPDANPTPAEPGGGESDFEEPDIGNTAEGGKPGEGDKSATGGDKIDLPPLGSKAGDVSMEEVLCDLLRALGVDCEHSGDEQQFKRNLYMAAMQKVHELTNKGMNKDDEVKAGEINKGNPPGSQPNPLIQQEQQPMYMSLEQINAIPDATMKSIALSMYTQNEVSKKKIENLEKSKIDETSKIRDGRIAKLSRISPTVKADLEKMKTMPSMALSMGEDGIVVDPMEPTIAMLEKGFAKLPQLFTAETAALSIVPQPTDDETALSIEEENKLVDDMSRRMGGEQPKKAS